MSLEGTLQEWYRRVWEEADVSAIDEMLAPDVTITGLEEGTFSDKDAFKLFHELVFRILRDIRPKILKTIEEGEWIAALIELNATVVANGEALSVQSHLLARIVDGKVVEGNNMIDFITAFQQIGVMPPRTLDHCLLGRSLSFA